MILDAYPALRDLAPQAKTQLAKELLAEANDSGEVELDPRLVSAVEERLAWFDAHPDATFTTEQVAARLQALKQRVAERHANA